MEEPMPFIVTVFGSPYTANDGGYVFIPLESGSWKTKMYRRLTPKQKPPEASIDMQKRIEEDIVDGNARKVRRAYMLSICCTSR